MFMKLLYVFTHPFFFLQCRAGYGVRHERARQEWAAHREELIARLATQAERAADAALVAVSL